MSGCQTILQFCDSQGADRLWSAALMRLGRKVLLGGRAVQSSALSAKRYIRALMLLAEARLNWSGSIELAVAECMESCMLVSDI